MKKLKKIGIVLVILTIICLVIWQIPSIADFADYETDDMSSSYDDWGSSSSDWGSSSSSSSWDDDYSWGSSSSSSLDGDDIFWILHMLSHLFGGGIMSFICILIIIFVIIRFLKKNGFGSDGTSKTPLSTVMQTQNDYREIKQKIFGYDDTPIETKIQAEDPMFNKAEFLGWASDMFVKLQYAWSDRNLEEVRYFVTPELYEKTNNQVQRYITNKQINKLERVSVNLSKLKSYEHEGDRDVLKVIFDTKMIDYIIDEKTGNVIRGNQGLNIMNPYILTFVRKTGTKTPEGGIKPVTMNCPNCGGATKILSSGKCPYCGSIITTRDNNWTLSEMSRYTPNS